MGFISALAEQTAGGAIGAGMGLLLGKYNDKRQLEQQQKLQNMQISGQEHLMGVAQRNQLDMWNKTNFGAQMQHLKTAGLNPGLLYGMGGSGGATTGSSSGNVSGSNAPTGGGEVGMGIQQALQMQMLKAQKENIEADTANKLAENPNFPLKGENISADTKLKGSQRLTENERKDSLAYDNIIKDLLVNRDEHGNLVAEDKDRLAFKQQSADYLKKILEQANISANTQKSIAQIAQGWQSLSLHERQIKLNEALAEANLNNKDQDQIIQIISNILNNLTHGLINFNKKPNQRIDNSYRPTEIYNQ